MSRPAKRRCGASMGVRQLCFVTALLLFVCAAEGFDHSVLPQSGQGGAGIAGLGSRRMLQQAASHSAAAAAALGGKHAAASATAPQVAHPFKDVSSTAKAASGPTAAAVPPGKPDWTHEDLCSDHPPPGKYGCDEQRDFDKCFADFMIVGDFCRRTCGRCQGVCNDIQPPGEFTCQEQKQFDKCDEHYVRDWGYCAATCDRCDLELAGNNPKGSAAAGRGEASNSTASSAAGNSATGSPPAPSPAVDQAAVDDAAVQAALEKANAAGQQAPAAAPPAHKATHAPKQHQHQHDAGSTPAHAATTPNTTHVVKHAGDGDGDDGEAVTVHTDGSGTVVVHKHSIFAYIHGILMVAAFGVIIPLGIFTSRYGKFWGGWFQTHRAVQTIGWVVAAAGFVLALTMHKLADWMKKQHEAEQAGRRLLHAGHEQAVLHDAAWQARHKIYLVHKYVGIAVFVAISLQLTSLFARPNKKARLRSTWSWCHFLLGWALLAAALFNNYEGLVLVKPLAVWWFVGYGALVAVIIGWVVIAEVRRCVYGHELEGYKQAGENGDVEMVGGSREERQGLTGPDTLNGNGDAGEGKFDLGDLEDDEELAFATAKYAKD